MDKLIAFGASLCEESRFYPPKIPLLRSFGQPHRLGRLARKETLTSEAVKHAEINNGQTNQNLLAH